MGLENRVAVITGATGGLGRVVARGLADAGANLALISTSGDNLAVLVNDLSLAQGRYLTHAADLTDPRRAPEAAAAVQAKFGRVDILLHLVGGWAGGKTVVQLPAEEMAAMLRQHLWSTLYVAQAFVPQLVANSWGRIVVVSSPLATRPAAKSAVYTVAKAAEETLLLALAQEVAGSGVTANIIQVRTIDAQHRRDREHTSETASWTTPEEIAAAILYLCSDAGGVVNGARLPLHGAR
ncbi:MAG: SDR family oxidoreductase [Chloroflexi bacterium]|nr:SDR family oxidoreductase [Chloroflexota bacterium]